MLIYYLFLFKFYKHKNFLLFFSLKNNLLGLIGNVLAKKKYFFHLPISILSTMNLKFHTAIEFDSKKKHDSNI